MSPDSLPTLEAQARALAERAARTMECSGNDAHTVFATGETAAIILSALQDAEARGRQPLEEALLSALPYVEAACGAKGLTAGMAEATVERINAALRARATETAK